MYGSHSRHPKSEMRSLRCEKILIRLILALLSVGFFSGCRRKSNAVSGAALSIDAIDNEARDYVRSALVNALPEDPSVIPDVSKLFLDGSVEFISAGENFSASQSEYSSIIAMNPAYRAGQAPQEKPIRLETIRINKPLPPVTLRASGTVAALQLSLSAGTMIKIYRQFASTTEEQNTPRFEMSALPVSLENAESLRVGDLVVLPLDGQMMTSVDGSFFRHSWSMGRTIDSILGSSLAGQAQTGLRANLVVDGRFELHIFKVDKNLVRVRIFQQNEKSFSTTAYAGGSAAARVRVIPFSKIHQIGEIIKSSEVRISGSQKIQLPQQLQKLSGPTVLQDLGLNSAVEAAKFAQEVEKRPDGLVDFSLSINRSPEQIQNRTTARINSFVDQMNPQTALRIRKTAQSVYVYADQELRLDASVSWSEARSGKQQFYADYVFNLRDEGAAEAYLHAVSGGSMLLSSRADLDKFILKGRPLHNLVLAERLATSHATKSSPAVTKLLSASAKSEVRESQFQIRFAKQVAYELSETWQREQYQLSRGSFDSDIAGSLIRWSFRNSVMFGLVGEKRERSSGFMSDVLTQPGFQSMYWYLQEVDSRSIGQSHLQQFLIQAHNILGPVAPSLGLDKLYAGEAQGRFRGRIAIGFSPLLLDLIFDPRSVSEERVWRAAAGVADTFDNSFGLPFLVMPAGVPAGIAGTGNEAACQRIAYHWGSFYCHFLAQEFLPKLRAAQVQGSAEAKGKFLETFFGRGFGANKVGSDLLARLVLQVAIDLKGRLSGNDVVVTVEGRHQGSSAPEFNPRVSYGNSKIAELLGQTLPAW